jgi:hypothetical protein
MYTALADASFCSESDGEYKIKGADSTESASSAQTRKNEGHPTVLTQRRLSWLRLLKRQVSDKVFRARKATAMTESSTNVVLSRVNQILF